MAGSQKIPVRWLGTLRDLLEKEAPAKGLSLALATWLEHWRGTSEGGRALRHSDPLAEAMARRYREHGDDTVGLARSYLGGQSVLRGAPGLDDAATDIGRTIARIRSRGLRSVLRDAAGSERR